MLESLLNSNWIFLLLLWVLPWKGVALWRAARNSHKKWFIALLVVNTMALLEIVYIFYFSKPKKQ
ncbi:MAG: hypothetical protein A2654_02545 [Candidatus Nealsonbacteria bacterium RIFCSPHIGHO2_01_FULL_43_31]|uniref:DUF5652 domain-containing protein n=2 Tax=Candidatus Nealsoniibacteriota TaxID=1817911 RepID=A0A1G2E9U0_9BACT|nr:MAG: hypothetical protein UV98_C0034G0008 [Parcubacteria group bacterium GW2011_GWB1_43_6]OGZ20051.1 MAG: hypothetical protein A2654_02545 [Candidatus Nealsonbacteria bacterium RIFCSPHIGHO2_01_FULL_43_31]OGZ21928.1 MAG: hypothetical protein A3D46_03085 [Candidatus Nealsonbacteria bacterium RIFCSPHIGHO2_02_FULL_43_13]OGZ24869.1 MAG: hypothetical protein A2922_02880 [Candidatus Nealsonbacteria bacterium RIFCSPLOWO2_01_FULL_43_36]